MFHEGHFTNLTISFSFLKSSLEHDDSLTDRSEGGVLNKSFETTKALWLEKYGKEYKVEGGMYRGEAPGKFYNGILAKNALEVNYTISKDQVVECSHETQDPRSTQLKTSLILHLIGEEGASSFGREESNPRLVPWMSLDDPRAFKTPTPKSMAVGVNANPRKDMYVFGNGREFIFACKINLHFLHYQNKTKKLMDEIL